MKLLWFFVVLTTSEPLCGECRRWEVRVSFAECIVNHFLPNPPALGAIPELDLLELSHHFSVVVVLSNGRMWCMHYSVKSRLKRELACQICTHRRLWASAILHYEWMLCCTIYHCQSSPVTLASFTVPACMRSCFLINFVSLISSIHHISCVFTCKY